MGWMWQLRFWSGRPLGYVHLILLLNEVVVDEAVPAFLDATGLADQECGREGGFKIEVLDNNIWDPPLSRAWTPPNGSGKFWDKWTKEAGNSWTRAMTKFYTGEALVLPNGEKVAAASSIPPIAAVPSSSANAPPAVSTVSADSAPINASTGTATVATGETCTAQGLWSCSADKKWLIGCDTSGSGLSKLH